MERLTVDVGIDLSVVRWNMEGGGRPVLLVHGLASNAHLWDGVAAALASRGHPVVAVDQRGHGRSSKPSDGYDFATLKADLHGVVDAVGWANRAPVLAGQSWGGNVVLEFAAGQASGVGALVLVDGGTIELSTRFADWPTCEAALAPPRLEGTSAAEFERMLRTHHPDWPETGIAGTLANAEVLADGTIRPWLRRENHMKILRHLWEHHPSDLYPSVAVPVLALMADDPANRRWMAGKREEVARAQKLLARSEVHWIEGDHDLHAQHPDLVADLIDRIAERAR
jgi:pimeloyl-ACP methyl ester carboxylesterase